LISFRDESQCGLSTQNYFGGNSESQRDEVVVEIWGEGKKICTFPRKTECRLLVDQSHYEGTDSDTGKAPVPLGKIGREIVIPRSWEIEDAPRRSIDHYAELVGTRS